MAANNDQDGPGSIGRTRAEEIRKYILAQLSADEFRDVTRQTAERFRVTRQAVHKQLTRLLAKSLIEGRGRTKSREYRLAVTESHTKLKVAGLQEDKVWHEFAEASLRDLPTNVLDICYYGFTEIVNNVVDHSGSENVILAIVRTATSVEMRVLDKGIGVFRKIQQALELPSQQEALFELTKGKLTTDPSRHTGEGIFYTSRAFDKFACCPAGYA